MLVDLTEIQNNFEQYLDLSCDQEIIITRNGQPIARLIGVKDSLSFFSDRLVGLVPTDVDEKAMREERRLVK